MHVANPLSLLCGYPSYPSFLICVHNDNRFWLIALYTDFGYCVNSEVQGWRGMQMISYERLWATMREKDISQYALIHTHGISPAQITRLKRNESVSTHTIAIFCKILSCRVEDIMEYVPDNSEL